MVLPSLCQYCGLTHNAKCSLIKAYEYYEGGALKRVEFYAPNELMPLTAPSSWVSVYGQPGTSKTVHS